VIDLRRFPLFAEFTPAEVEAVTARLRRVDLCAGESLFADGDLGDAAYIVAEGIVELVRSRGGRYESVAVLGPGAMLGELSLVDAGPRTATCVAIEDSSLLELGEVAFAELFRSPAGLKFVQAVNRSLLAAQSRADGRLTGGSFLVDED